VLITSNFVEITLKGQQAGRQCLQLNNMIFRQVVQKGGPADCTIKQAGHLHNRMGWQTTH